MLRSSGLPATRTQTDHFDGLAFHSKADIQRAIDDCVADALLLKLDGGMAVAADQKLALMRVLGVAATNKGIE